MRHVLVASMLLAACGGSSSEPTATPSTASSSSTSTETASSGAESAAADPWASRSLVIPGELASRADVIAALDPLLREARACLVGEGSAEPAVGSLASVVLFTAPAGTAQNVNLGWKVSDEELAAVSGRARGDVAACVTGVLSRAALPASADGLEVDFDLP